MRIRFYEHQLQRLIEEGNARQHGFGYETARSTKTKGIRALKEARIFVPGETMPILMNPVAFCPFLLQIKDADR
jgi:hypothetical protein